jgi:hypothetical protein
MITDLVKPWLPSRPLPPLAPPPLLPSCTAVIAPPLAPQSPPVQSASPSLLPARNPRFPHPSLLHLFGHRSMPTPGLLSPAPPLQSMGATDGSDPPTAGSVVPIRLQPLTSVIASSESLALGHRHRDLQAVVPRVPRLCRCRLRVVSFRSPSS